MPKLKGAQWLTEQVNDSHLSKAKILKKHGFKVTFVRDINELFSARSTQRTSYIFISDSGSEPKILKTINELTSHSDTKTAKFILSIEDFKLAVIKHACANSFRGVISMDLPNPFWEQQINFITSSGMTHLKFQSGMITLNHLCQIRSPARIVSMSKESLRIECSLRAARGDMVTVGGKFTAMIGRKQIEFTISSTSTTKLVHRFSNAYEFDLKKVLTPEEQVILGNKINPRLMSPPVRIFCVIKNNRLRQVIGKAFDGDEFDLTSALQIKSMVYEPSFLSPDVVIVEETFVSGIFEKRFNSMISTQSATTKILILKSSKSDLSYLQSKFENVQLMNTDDFEFSATSLALVCQTETKNNPMLYFKKTDPLTYIDIIVKGHVRAIHPLQVEVSCSKAISKYAHFQIETPLLGQIFAGSVWCKNRTTYQNLAPDRGPNDLYVMEGYLNSTRRDRRSELTALLARTITKMLDPFVMSNKQPVTNQDISDFDFVEDVKSTRPFVGTRTAKAASKKGPRTVSVKSIPIEMTSRYKNLFVAIVIVICIGAFLKLLLPIAARDLQRSGKIYSEKLKFFQKGQLEDQTSSQ